MRCIRHFFLSGLLAVLTLPLVGCGKHGPKKSPSLPPWPRAHYQPGGSNAVLYFVLYGKFQPGAEVSAKEYRTAGLPQGMELRFLTRSETPEFPFTDEAFGKVAGKNNPELFAKIRTAPECLVLLGQIPDPQDLNYLRDMVGLITFSLDHGAAAVLDVQQLRLIDSVAWRKEFFEPKPPQLRKHVVILVSEEPDGSIWLHTRGMRKFGRPDLSVHRVPPEQQNAFVECLNRFILLQIDGGTIPENQEVTMAKLPPGLTCHLSGTIDDPDFNNVHVEIQWPAKPAPPSPAPSTKPPSQ